MSNRSETLQEIINGAVDAASRNLWTAIPAKVIKWDASTGRANVQILVKNSYEDEEGTRQSESVAVVTAVPIQFMGAGGYRLTFPIGDGSGGSEQTIGTLFFAHRSLDKWLSGSGQEVDPEFDHHHAQMDAIFMPGLKPFGAPWGSVPTDHATLGADSGVQIHLYGTAIKLGSDTATEAVPLGNTLKTALQAMSDSGLATAGASLSTAGNDPTFSGVPANAVAAPAIAAAGAALTAASVALDIALATILSTIVKTA